MRNFVARSSSTTVLFLISCILLLRNGDEVVSAMIMGGSTIEDQLDGLVGQGRLTESQEIQILAFVGATKATEQLEHNEDMMAGRFADQAVAGYISKEVAEGSMTENTALYIKSLLNLASADPILAPVSANYNTSESFGIVNFLGRWETDVGFSSFDDIYNGIWGFKQGRFEYALQCNWNGVNLIDVTNPAEPELVQIIYMPGGEIWRDVVTYYDSASGKTYAYVAAQYSFQDLKNDLYIIDLSYLPRFFRFRRRRGDVIPPEGIKLVPGFGDDGHTVAINEELGYLLLNTATEGSGVKILDLAADPWSPPFIAQWTGGDGHDSDILVGTEVAGFDGPRDILISADGNEQLFRFIDITDIRADFADSGLVELTMADVVGETNFIEGQYAHSVVLTEDGTVMYALEEANLFDVAIYDISDVTNPIFIRYFQYSEESITNSYVHNGRISGNKLIMAYYEVGLRVYDISEPRNPLEIGHFETHRDPDGDFIFNDEVEPFYDGAWNIFELPSGNILVPDTITGLFIFSLD